VVTWISIVSRVSFHVSHFSEPFFFLVEDNAIINEEMDVDDGSGDFIVDYHLALDGQLPHFLHVL
jgi:hypothetical protein